MERAGEFARDSFSACSRADASWWRSRGTARRQVSWLADAVLDVVWRTALHSKPSHASHSGCRFEPARGMQLPAYSGGTAWALHPLRVTAGQSRRCDFRQLDVSLIGEYNMRSEAGLARGHNPRRFKIIACGKIKCSTIPGSGDR